MDLFASLLKMTTNAKESMEELVRILESFYDRLIPNLYEEYQRMNYVDQGVQTGEDMSDSHWQKLVAEFERNEEVAKAFGVLDRYREKYQDEETRKACNDSVRNMTKRQIETLSDFQTYFESLVRSAQFELFASRTGTQGFLPATGLDKEDIEELHKGLELARRISIKHSQSLKWDPSERKPNTKEEWEEYSKLFSLQYQTKILKETLLELRKRQGKGEIIAVPRFDCSSEILP